MREDLELKLQEEFSFMKRDMTIKEKTGIHSAYQAWGCQCAGGWYLLIRELCQAITDRYAQDNIAVDLVVKQIKEKFASLRFYYAFEDTTFSFQTIDFGDPSLGSEPHNMNDTKKKLRHDISQIVRAFELKSKTICEICGEEGHVRMNRPWKRTLCDACNEDYLKKLEERQKRKC